MLYISASTGLFSTKMPKWVVRDKERLDECLIQEVQANHYGISADKGYKAAPESLRVIHPKNVYQNYSLSGNEGETN